MVSLIVGEKGKGKTQYLLEMANESVKTAEGHIVYIDKDKKHMHDLTHKVRLIDASTYPLQNGDEFIGFICGIASQDHDLEKVYLDNFLKNTKVTDDAQQIAAYIKELESISTLCNVDFIISISKDKTALAPEIQDNIIVAL